MGTIYKRGKTYWIKYSRNGKWYFESSQSRLKSVASELLKKREGEIQKGQIPGIHFDRIIFDELAEDFKWDREVNGKNVAEAQKRIDHLEKFFKGMKVTAITNTHIREYIEDRIGEGAANATINRELAALKRMFNLGARERPPKVDKNQVPYIKMLQEKNIRKGFLEYGEYLALIDALPEYLKGFVAFGYRTGWRKEEICSRKWQHVDLEVGIVRLEPGETKNGKGRTVYLDEELKAILQDQWEKRKSSKKILPYVFLNARGTDRIKQFDKAWKKACKAAGIGRRVFHDLRRSAVRNMVRSGISEHTAMKISGHKTRAIFDRYDIVSDFDLEQAAKKQAEYFDRVTKTVTIVDIKEKRANHNVG